MSLFRNIGGVAAVGLGADDNIASVCSILCNRIEFSLGIEVSFAHGFPAVIGNGENEQSIILYILICQLAAVNIVGADCILRAELDKCCIASGVIAADIEVYMAVINTDIEKLGGIEYLKLIAVNKLHHRFAEIADGGHGEGLAAEGCGSE